MSMSILILILIFIFFIEFFIRFIVSIFFIINFLFANFFTELFTCLIGVLILFARVYERILLDADAQALGITVTGNVISIPDKVTLGTKVHLTVASIFDTSKSITLTTTVNAKQEEEELKNNLSVAAHLIHGSSDDKFKVTYCTKYLSKEEVESAGFDFMPYDEAVKKYNPETLKDGYNTINGEEIYYISNPALGLWTI